MQVLVPVVYRMLTLDFRAAEGAVVCVVGNGTATFAAFGPWWLLGSFADFVADELCADDACGDCHDGVAEEHDKCAEDTSSVGYGGYVAISYGGHGDYCPVDAGGNVGEWCVGYIAFDHVHEGT